MKKIIYANQEYEAERIVKSDDSIVGYTKGSVAFRFNGVSDFSGFTLTDGQEFDVPELTEIEKIRIEQAQANSELVQLIMMTGGA